MGLEPLSESFSICKVTKMTNALRASPFVFVSRTDEELSVVCPTALVPKRVEARNDGWRAFRIQGILDFSLVGILSAISVILAKEKIGIFAVSTYNTDYVFIHEKDFDHALEALAREGYELAD